MRTSLKATCILFESVLCISIAITNCNCGFANDSAKLNKLIQKELECEDRGDLIGAIEVCKNIIADYPRNVETINTLAGLYGKMQTAEGTKQELRWAEKAIQINPKYAKAYINRGNVFLNQGLLERAGQDYQIAIKLEPNSPFGYYSQGVIEERREHFDKALKLYQRSVEVDPSFADGYFNLAATYANLHHFEDAKKAIKKVLSLNPNEQDAKDMLKQIEQDSAK